MTPQENKEKQTKFIWYSNYSRVTVPKKRCLLTDGLILETQDLTPRTL